MIVARYLSLLAAVICAGMVIVAIVGNNLWWAGWFGFLTLYDLFMWRITAPSRR